LTWRLVFAQYSAKPRRCLRSSRLLVDSQGSQTILTDPIGDRPACGSATDLVRGPEGRTGLALRVLWRLGYVQAASGQERRRPTRGLASPSLEVRRDDPVTLRDYVHGLSERPVELASALLTPACTSVHGPGTIDDDRPVLWVAACALSNHGASGHRNGLATSWATIAPRLD
jgi:hypothetical protein